MKKTILFAVLALSTFNCFAQQFALSGHITGGRNLPIPFASVYIKNSTYGTTANENGDYMFKLRPGTYDIVYRVVGFKEDVERISISAGHVEHNVQLTAEPFELKPVISKETNKNDPAYDIMHHVVDKRKFYLNEVKSYQCAIYVKGVKKIITVPKTLLDKGMAKLLGLDTSGKGIAYQSESLSTYSFKQKDEVKEIFAASKVSGSNPPFGYNKASDLQVNFYKNLFYINGLSTHGFVSPVSTYAFKYYKFKLLGTISEDGKQIDKIQVQTRIGKALSFTGSIYIIEGDWRIYGVDLYLTKALNNLNFVDTLRVTQQYIPVGNTWEPLSFQYSYNGNVNGLRFSGYYLGINNNYKIDTVFKENYFNGEILHVDTEANKRSAAFWADKRPVPLTSPEVKNYKTRDSIAKLQESKTYQDSIQRDENKFALLPYLVDGYLATYKNHKDSLFVFPLLQTVYYNTVEGWGINLKGSFTKTFEDNRSFSVSPALRYGTADKMFSANIHSSYTYDPDNVGKFFVDFGSDVPDLNTLGTRSLYFNTLSTLISEQNFVKYYRSVFANFGYQRELTNGILWTANLSYADRTQLYNTSFNHIFTYSHLRYTSNNPLAPDAPQDDHSILFPENQALTFNTSLRFTFDQQYITRPTGKVYLPSDYPVITVNYRKGINNVLGSDVNYDFVAIDITDERLAVGLLGHSAFKIKAGAFFNNRNLYFMDYNHFIGNEGTSSDPTYVGSFHFLPFYTFSTKDPFLEFHFQHNFGGAIFDNVPFLRRLKLEEIVGANYLTEKNNPYYSEFYFGIKRLQFGADYGVAYQGNKKYLQGFRIFYGLK
ncbi:DUF5686 family protein [Mucilaginibacter gotjawali]|uniref:Carboxypeptidase-like regulatory domain-containing protein n=2 Tax=Mucilaginibacter gotjawali TaxID=1550579 RepID=A0A839SB64_9SPHI|nr:DUF5686 family protein [Mucilaginibacter gotjawali]MBB3055411.1 hypothetical protein [Mucilaginibacter gotjawali]